MALMKLAGVYNQTLSATVVTVTVVIMCKCILSYFFLSVSIQIEFLIFVLFSNRISTRTHAIQCAPPDGTTYSLWMGGITADTTEQFILDAFKSMGFRPCHVHFATGFCFVHFGTESERNRAMKQLNAEFIPSSNMRFKLKRK